MTQVLDTINAKHHSIWARFKFYTLAELQFLKSFIKAPKRTLSDQPTQSEKWKRLLLIYLLDIFLLLLVLPLLGVLNSYFHLENKLAFIKFSDFFILCLVAPILEELIFRLGLRSIIYTLLIGPVLIAMFVGTWQVAILLALVQIVFSLWIRYCTLTRFGKEKIGAKFAFGRQFIQHYSKIFWLYVFAFSIIHVLNYSLTEMSNFVVILFVLPQVILGLLLGYLRIRDGFLSAFLLHAIHNSMLTTLILTFA